MIIRRAVVLGAGTMGAQIALHLANAGVPSVLLDVSREAAAQGLERARRLKPDPQFTPDAWRLVRTGGLGDDLALVHDADWIVEAVVERIEVKRELLARVMARQLQRPSSAPTPRASRWAPSPRAGPRPTVGAGSAPTSSIRPVTSRSSS
ncbi:MAG: 3-hydroxyacyl-CoA dehydrogenase NAD-binding domain-containing protein [Vicinamibacterales bacterium]